MSILRKVLLMTLSVSVWLLVINLVAPPKSWPEANALQIIAFFVPLLLALTFFYDILFSYLPHSFFTATGTMMVIVFYAINQLSWISFGLIVLLTFLSVKYFPVLRLPRLRLTRLIKIPKITPNRK